MQSLELAGTKRLVDLHPESIAKACRMPLDAFPIPTDVLTEMSLRSLKHRFVQVKTGRDTAVGLRRSRSSYKRRSVARLGVDPVFDGRQCARRTKHFQP